MAKIVITHHNPDLDALVSVWLVKKFFPDWQGAEVSFVPTGETYQGKKVDSNPQIIHVDTGLGKFDHHQLKEKTCAAELVFKYLKQKNIGLKEDKALVRLIEVVRQIDNFEDCLWPHPEADYHNFSLANFLEGLKSSGKLDDSGIINFGSQCLEGIYTKLKTKIKAEKDLKIGYNFDTVWGKAIGCLTHNSGVLKLGQKLGYSLVVQKNPRTEDIRIKARPDSLADFTSLKEKLAKLDPKATWFLHISKRMLLNGSRKNPKMRPSRLSLKKVISVLENETRSN